MFEKEAKEYAKAFEKEFHTSYGACLQSFQGGAEFGYHKANEWHNQNMDDVYNSISKDWGIRHFICIMKDKSLNTAIGCCDESCSGEVMEHLFFDYNDEKYHVEDIVWWKEIILPKEIEK